MWPGVVGGEGGVCQATGARLSKERLIVEGWG